MDALSLITEVFAPLPGRRILDIGCGGGYLARALTGRGARVTGVDPAAVSIETARQTSPDSEFHCAGAEALPFADGLFDGAVFLNSLHHIPVPAMAAALREARRVAAGPVLVIEPLATGTYFTVVRCVDDETDVRAAAQAAARASVADGVFTLAREAEFERDDVLTGPDQLVARMLAADRSRHDALQEHGARLHAAFHELAEPLPDGRFSLKQPHLALVLEPQPGSR